MNPVVAKTPELPGNVGDEHASATYCSGVVPAGESADARNVQQETIHEKFSGIFRFPGNAREKLEPRDFLS